MNCSDNDDVKWNYLSEEIIHLSTFKIQHKFKMFMVKVIDAYDELTLGVYIILLINER